jgi:hypothetical protein
MKESRLRRLMPNGKPRYIRVYDNDDKTIDRYTVVYTGNFSKRLLYHSYYVGMSANPFNPAGFGQHGECEGYIDYPKYSHLGKKISFEQLPADCKKLVISDYKAYWSL